MAMPSLPDDRTMNSRRVKPTNIVLFLAILINHEKVDSLIVQGPSDTTAMVNESTYFNCSTSVRPTDERSIIWYHYPLYGGGQRDDVYDEGIIRTNYINRFEIYIDLSSGSLNLIALRLEPKDAGRYECKDHVHQGIGASAELTVLGPDLVCESDMDPGGVLGPTQCERAIEPDEIQLSCGVTYNGKNAPQMVWGKSGDSSNSTKTDCVNNDNGVTCNTTLTANLQLNESVYICELPTQQQYCSLKMKNMLYAFANKTKIEYNTGDEVTCVADASTQLPCSYQWYKDNTTEVSSNETFKPNDPGLYICQAQCLIRNDSCKFTAMVISVSTVPDSGPNLLHCLWLLWLVPVIGVIMAIRYKRIWLKWLRRCRRENESETPSANESEDLTHRPQEEQPPAIPPEQLPEQSENSAHELQTLLSNQNAATNEGDSDDTIDKAFDKANRIRKGLCGEIRGPGQHKVNGVKCNCAYEKVFCEKNQHALANEGEMSVAESTVCCNGRKWMALNHNNLIKFYDVVLKSPAVYIVMEFAAGGSVGNALNAYKEDLPTEVVMDWATQIAQGLSYLHDEGIVHKNIKSDQIFILEPPDIPKKTLRIGCFNLFEDGTIHDGSSLKENCSYSSPEEYSGGSYSGEKSYVWSFGIVVWEILTKKKIYANFTALKKIAEDREQGAPALKIPESCPEELKEIIEKCRIKEPSGRPTFMSILKSLGKWCPLKHSMVSIQTTDEDKQEIHTNVLYL